MASRTDRFFAWFEGEANDHLLAVFRVAFFGGVAAHFFPYLLDTDDSYRRGALRSDEWNHWLFLRFDELSPGTVNALAFVTMAAVIAALLGFRTRTSATVAGLGCYAFASFNGLPVQTLALVNTWAIFMAYALADGGSGRFSVDAWMAKREGKELRRETRLLPGLIVTQVWVAVFFAGIEKVLAGWPFVNEMGVVMSYPKGFLLRNWVTDVALLRAPFVTKSFTWFTIFVELLAPPLLLWKRTRLWALLSWELLFLGIIAMLEVPPLFFCMFAFGPLLLLDDADVTHLVGRFRK